MTQTSETVTYSLESVLTRIESKIDTLQRDVTDLKSSLLKKGTIVNYLKVEVTEIKGDIKTLDQKV